MSAVNVRSIQVDPAGRVVVTGQGGQVFRSTPALIGAGLLASMTGRGEEAAGGPIQWLDTLASHGLAYGNRGRQGVTIVATTPALSQSVTIHHRSDTADRRTDRTFTFPPLLVGLRLGGNGKHQKSYLWCLKPERTQPLALDSTETILQPFPFGNVHPHGEVCWGTVAPHDITSVASFLTLFFGSGFNHDLWRGGLAQVGSAVPVELGRLEGATQGATLIPPAAWNISLTQAVAYL